MFGKAEARESQRQKDEARKFKKLEAAFRQLIKSTDVTYDTPWEEARLKFEGDKAFEAITLESERVRIYKVNQIGKNSRLYISVYISVC